MALLRRKQDFIPRACVTQNVMQEYVSLHDSGLAHMHDIPEMIFACEKLELWCLQEFLCGTNNQYNTEIQQYWKQYKSLFGL